MPSHKHLPAEKQARVLVVDGSERHLREASEALKAAGFKVVGAAREEALLPLFDVFRPSVVVLATHAPDFTSTQVARRLQQLSRGSVPIVYLVDAPDPELRHTCFERGHGVDVLSKPLDLRELVQKVTALVRLQTSTVKNVKAQATDTLSLGLRDEVTRVFHRRTLLAFVGHEARRGERHGNNFSLVVARLNGLKQFRSDFGRGRSDRLLVYMTVVLKQSVREADVVARVDDETFAILLPDMRLESVGLVRERLLARFGAARFSMEGCVVRPSVSVGSASFPDVVGAPAQMLSAAMLDLKRASSSPTQALSRSAPWTPALPKVSSA